MTTDRYNKTQVFESLLGNYLIFISIHSINSDPSFVIDDIFLLFRLIKYNKKGNEWALPIQKSIKLDKFQLLHHFHVYQASMVNDPYGVLSLEKKRKHFSF